MKKIFPILLIPALFLFDSCLGNKDDNPSAVEPGVLLYGLARFQADMDLDPLLLAFKLQTLITTAAEEGQDYASVKVTIPASDEDGDDKEIVVVDQLFGADNKVTKNGDEWTLDYTSNTRLEKERYTRSGEIVINTYGLNLDQLALDPSYKWDITIPDDGYGMAFMSGGNFVNRISACSIVAGDKENTWVITGHSASYNTEMPEYAANWDFEYTLCFPGEASFSYNDILNSTFLLDAEIDGIPAAGNTRAKYTAVDLKYKPRCYQWYIFGGYEYIEVFDRAMFPVDTYPELKVKYMWLDQSSSTPCYNTVEISYNGYTASA